MPIRQRDNKWYWGSKGPFNSRKKAEEVSQAAHASGYKEKSYDKFIEFMYIILKSVISEFTKIISLSVAPFQ